MFPGVTYRTNTFAQRAEVASGGCHPSVLDNSFLVDGMQVAMVMVARVNLRELEASLLRKSGTYILCGKFPQVLIEIRSFCDQVAFGTLGLWRATLQLKHMGPDSAKTKNNGTPAKKPSLLIWSLATGINCARP